MTSSDMMHSEAEDLAGKVLTPLTYSGMLLAVAVAVALEVYLRISSEVVTQEDKVKELEVLT